MSRNAAHMSLYLMQNEVGFVKIGRSVDPEKRRETLSSVERCRLELLHIWPGAGDREESVHSALQDHCVGGEWFDGTAAARATIVRVLGLPADFTWPFELNSEAAEAWLEAFFERQFDKSIQRDVGRAHELVRTAAAPGWTIDSAAWDMHWLIELGDRPVGYTCRGADGETTVIGWLSDGQRMTMPRYTTSLEAALDLWPEGARPCSWTGSALDCCKAALEFRRREWNELRRALRRRGLEAAGASATEVRPPSQ